MSKSWQRRDGGCAEAEGGLWPARRITAPLNVRMIVGNELIVGLPNFSIG